MTTLKLHNETTIKANGTHGTYNNKPVLCIDTGEIFVSIMDAAEHFGVNPTNVSNTLLGRQKTCKGMHFCYLSKADEHLEAITNRIRETSMMEEDARKWREYQAEQERIRKVEAERQEKIAKANEKLERRREIVRRLQAQLSEATERVMEVERELEALNREEENAA